MERGWEEKCSIGLGKQESLCVSAEMEKYVNRKNSEHLCEESAENVSDS